MKLASFMRTNKGTILAVTAVVGVIGTGVLVAHGAMKAKDILDEEAEIREENGEEPMQFLDKVKITWKCYLPSALTGVATITSILGGNASHIKKEAALTNIYEVAAKTHQVYKEKVKEVVGEKKELQAAEETSKQIIADNPVGDRQIIITGKGTQLCYDTGSDRYFESSVEEIMRVTNDLNAAMIDAYNVDAHGQEDFTPANDWYMALGLKPNVFGDLFGWTTSYPIKIRIDAHLNEEGKPAIAIIHENLPLSLPD